MSGVRIGSASTLNIQRGISTAATSVAKASERLSSGQRINKASDDSASLAISSTLNTQSKILTQAIRNLNDGVSANSVMQQAMQELSNITTRQRELATQSANQVYSDKQRQALDKEAQQLNDEFNRIVQSTEFNGIKLFASPSEQMTIQCGTGDQATISFKYAEKLFTSSDSATVESSGTVTAGSYFTLSSSTKDMYVWFRVDGVGVDPAVGGAEGKRVDLLSSDLSAQTVAQAVAAKLGAADGVSTSFAGDGVLNIIDLATGTVTDAAFGSGTGFTVSTIEQGAAGAQTYNVGAGTQATFGDVNGDGSLDIISPNRNADTLSILLNDGNGNFTLEDTVTIGGSPMASYAVDMNNDGINEIVTAEYSGTISIVSESGNVWGASSYNLSGGTSELVFSDFNGDGYQDIASADRTADSMSVLLSDGFGGFNSPATYAAGSSVCAITMGDVNGDGRQDLITAANGEDKISVFMGSSSGDGSFDAAVTYTTGNPAQDVILTDVTGDGWLDIVTADYGNSSVSYLANLGDGTFNTAVNNTIAGGAYSITASDVDSDGNMDIVCATGNGLSILENSGGGALYETNYGGGNIYTVGMGDVNGDSIVDIVGSDLSGNAAKVYLGDGSGGFSAPTSYAAGDLSREVVLGDLNGDGISDFLVSNYNDGTVSVFTGGALGGAYETTQVSFASGNAGTSSAAAAESFSLATRQGALDAMSVLESRQNRINLQMGEYGAVASRFEVALNAVTDRRDQVKIANSRIMDADIAQEAANRIKSTITQQIGISILAQANQEPEIALSLLNNIRK